MKIKQILFAVLLLALFGCKAKEPEAEQQIVHPNTTTFYKTEVGTDAIQVAESIIYDVVIQNSSAEGTEWNDGSYYTSVTNVDVEAIANILFQAVYEQRLVPYGILTGEPMTIEEVKKMDLEFKRNRIAKMEFTEKWLMNENTLEMSKLISEIALGYESVTDSGEVTGYKPCFKVYLTDKEKNKTK